MASWIHAGALAALLVACGGSAELNGNIAGSGGTDSGHSAGSNADGGRADAGGTSAGGSGPAAAGGSTTSAGESGGGSAGEIEGGAGGTAGASGAGGAPRSCARITFDDPALEAAVRRSLGNATGEITPAAAAQLDYLDATDSGVTSLGGIECLGLKSAFFDDDRISDLQPLAALKDLHQLDLTNNPSGDLSPLSGLDHLLLLNLSGAPRTLTADDFTLIAQLPALVELDINFDTVGSLTPLAQAPVLEWLVVHTSQLLAPESLAALTNLALLDVSDTGVSPNAVSKLSQLQYLGFELNQAADISAFASLTGVQELDLSFNRLTDIAPLGTLTQLTRLALSGNQITDLGPLRALDQLNTLNAQSNQIQSLAPLLENPGIGAGDLLWLGENPLDCSAQAANIAALNARNVGVESDCTQRAP